MEIAKIAAVGIVAAVLAITLKKTNPEISLQVSLAAGIVILLMSVEYLAMYYWRYLAYFAE